MNGFTRALITFCLVLCQLLFGPDGHNLRPDSATWATLCYSSMTAFLLASFILAVSPAAPQKSSFLRLFWKGSFLVYLGTICSPIFKAPSAVVYLLFCSWPSFCLRALLHKAESS